MSLWRVDQATIDDWQKRLAVAAGKLLGRAEIAEGWTDTKTQLDAFAHVLELLTVLEELRRGPHAGKPPAPVE